MKQLLKIFAIAFITLCYDSIFCQTNRLVIGVLTDNVPRIENASEIEIILKEKVSIDAIVRNIEIQWDKVEKSYFLFAEVTGHDVAAIAIELEIEDNHFYFTKNPYHELVCYGKDGCVECKIDQNTCSCSMSNSTGYCYLVQRIKDMMRSN